MSDFTKKIFDIKSSKSYLDYNKYHMGNILGITKVSRWELMHSNFIAWLLDPKSTHALNYYSILQLIKCLEFLKDKSDNTNSRLDCNLIRKFYFDNYILSAEVQREFNNIDILIQVKTTDKILPIIIENKVNSKENGKNGEQTKAYYDWGEEYFKDRNVYFEPIYIFLLPEYNSKVIQKCNVFLRMTYQELVDYVVEPALYKCGDEEAKNNIRVYLQCLSYQTDNEKGEYTMAISGEERKILDEFIKENKNLLCAVINELKDEVDQSVLDSFTSTVRDYSTYKFNGEEFTKARLVLAVVEKYVEDYDPNSFADLTNVFPPSLQGSKGVVKLDIDVSNKDKGIGGQKRYFVDNPITLKSGEKVLVCTQWGIDNIKDFIQEASKYYSIN